MTAAFDTFMVQYRMAGREKADGDARDALYLVSALALLVSLAYIQPVRANAVDPRRGAGPDDVKNAQVLISALVKRSEALSEGVAPSITLAKPLYWASAEGGRLLVPMTIRYRGLANAYCRVATVSADRTEALFVEMPQELNADECRGFEAVRYLDINHDGVLDIVASVGVKSNSFDGYVAEQVAFLSSPQYESGYCYSARASHHLGPVDMQSGKKVQQALERERLRLGLSGFSCERSKH